ncbi:MAG: glycosyltransferase family 4 protein [Acidimicrobiia bacterium]|nr:glycosyltransferase family 4 protein [Acidimicrobiia bacterium]
MKLAIVVQRYGESINGGAELHARYVAERLARHATVEVLTTCARDYVTWKNELPTGVETVNGVQVRRFPVRRERDPLMFGRLSEAVFRRQHSVDDELRWLESEGPDSPGLISYLSKHASEFDYCIIFSYRYHHAYHAVRAVPNKAILVPTAERDPAVGLRIFGPIFRGVRALMYNSPEERAMIQAVSQNDAVPSVVVGVGSEIPANPQPQRFRHKFNVRGPFAIYVGRIDENKGCKELFDFFGTYLDEGRGRLSLVLIGNAILPVPPHPRIRHLGFLEDADKFDAIAAADLLVMPSYFESLSMVALEAWALGRPVVANGRCDVLRGQCVRSHAGLYYENRQEFVETLRALERTRWLNVTLGRNGREFYKDQYDWPVIERKYLDVIGRLSGSSGADIEPLPGWFDRLRPECPASADVVAALPAGPVVAQEMGREPYVTPPTPPPRRIPEGTRPRPVHQSHGNRPAPQAPASSADRGGRQGPPRSFHSRRGPHRGRPRGGSPRSGA